MASTVFLNGKFVPYDEAVVPVEDRGFVFADGIYEVIRFYGGKPFHMPEHLARLQRSAEAIKLALPYGVDEIGQIGAELIEREDLDEASLYLQVTRGVAPRSHPFPSASTPTIFMIARPVHPLPETAFREGQKCVIVADRRWHMCYIKSIALLPNILAKQEAKEQGGFEGIFVRDDGTVTEGTSTNVFAVLDGTVRTHPEGAHILAGITRQAVIDLAIKADYRVEEKPFSQEELFTASEVFLTGTTTEVLPVVNINDKKIGAGKPGPIALRLHEAFMQLAYE